MENKSFSTLGFNLCFCLVFYYYFVWNERKKSNFAVQLKVLQIRFEISRNSCEISMALFRGEFHLLIPRVLGLEYSDFIWNCYYFIKYAYWCVCTNAQCTHHTIVLPSKHFGYRWCIIVICSNFQLSVLHRVKSYNVKFIHDHVIFRYLVLFSCKCWLYWPQAHYQHSPNLTIRVHPCTGHGAAVSDEPRQFSFCYVFFYFYCWLNVHKLITYMKEFKWNGLFIAAIPVGFSLHFM